ncbi:TIGR02677 family protein [Streptomyces paludis]|uniref:TIGR02677 family protein n=1 Tax=Streptomyces paludis TaxID=2282738 RepID=A0A345I0W1_9ACTN|nr:TIGR02677 family protein [Streptomyces paludis]AXG82585.1 TIGR02677 family protein [Streptomyces paludis]
MREPAADSDSSWQRLTAYTYLSAPERLEYVAVMRVFCATLLADLAVPDVLAKLPGGALTAETLTARLEQLVRWGNLLRSSHTVKASSITEYQRARSRYQLSKLGERIQRDADEVLAGADAAREVSSELLALVERGLRELAGLVVGPEGATAGPGVASPEAVSPGVVSPGVEPQDALERVSTLFVQFSEFADSVRDFYAYLGQVLARYDLDSAEYQGFKELLLDYVEAITEDVAFRAPRIAALLERLWPALPGLLEVLDAHARGLSVLKGTAAGTGPAGPVETRVLRSRGRELADWEGLRGWFTDLDGLGSQVDQLRDATLRALQSLLANAKRMLRSASGEMSRRNDLLRLARWFDEATPEDAHDIAVAAFGMYGSRHLGVEPASDETVPAYTSWWTGPVVEVPVSLRERGSRAQRGRAATVEDHSAQKARLQRAAREQAADRRSAAIELRSASGRFAGIELTSAALALLLELLATALGNARLRGAHRQEDEEEPAGSDGFTLEAARSEDAELGIRLTVRRVTDARTVLRSVDGELLLDELTLTVEGLDGDGDRGSGRERDGDGRFRSNGVSPAADFAPEVTPS